MKPPSLWQGEVRVGRRPFLAGILAAAAAPAVVSLSAPAVPATRLERAIAEVHACRLAEMRDFGSPSALETVGTGKFVLHTLRAVARLRDAATAEGLTYAQYRATLDQTLRRAHRDYLEELPRPASQRLAA